MNRDLNSMNPADAACMEVFRAEIASVEDRINGLLMSALGNWYDSMRSKYVDRGNIYTVGPAVKCSRIHGASARRNFIALERVRFQYLIIRAGMHSAMKLAAKLGMDGETAYYEVSRRFIPYIRSCYTCQDSINAFWAEMRKLAFGEEKA